MDCKIASVIEKATAGHGNPIQVCRIEGCHDLTLASTGPYSMPVPLGCVYTVDQSASTAFTRPRGLRLDSQQHMSGEVRRGQEILVQVLHLAGPQPLHSMQQLSALTGLEEESPADGW